MWKARFNSIASSHCRGEFGGSCVVEIVLTTTTATVMVALRGAEKQILEQVMVKKGSQDTIIKHESWTNEKLVTMTVWKHHDRA